MEADFWHSMWTANRLGFHQAEYNPLLVRHWSTLGVEPGARVLVPLCGKSLDMVWLAESGHEPVGVELSPIAVDDFFRGLDGDGRPEERDTTGTVERVSRAPYTLFCGDFFEVGADLVGDIGAVYDRGALVALPPEVRPRYAAHVLQLMAAGATCLLLALEYDQAVTSGPPFSVLRSEVEALYGAAEVQELQRIETREVPPRFRELGIDTFAEVVYRISKR